MSTAIRSLPQNCQAMNCQAMRVEALIRRMVAYSIADPVEGLQSNAA
jgi:hypothetical protein